MKRPVGVGEAEPFICDPTIRKIKDDVDTICIAVFYRLSYIGNIAHNTIRQRPGLLSLAVCRASQRRKHVAKCKPCMRSRFTPKRSNNPSSVVLPKRQHRVHYLILCQFRRKKCKSDQRRAMKCNSDQWGVANGHDSLARSLNSFQVFANTYVTSSSHPVEL